MNWLLVYLCAKRPSTNLHQPFQVTRPAHPPPPLGIALLLLLQNPPTLQPRNSKQFTLHSTCFVRRFFEHSHGCKRCALRGATTTRLQPFRACPTTWCLLALHLHRFQPRCHNSQQVSVWDTAIGFAKTEMLPHAKLWDEKEIFPKEVLKSAGDLGFGSIYCRHGVARATAGSFCDNLCSPEYGGSDLGRLGAAVVFEALSTACPSTTACGCFAFQRAQVA